MTRPPGSWQPSPAIWPQVQHSPEVEHRITIVEVKVDQVTDSHEKFKDHTTGKILWLERGLQAVAYGLLTLAFWQAPQKAAGIAELLVGLLKK